MFSDAIYHIMQRIKKIYKLRYKDGSFPITLYGPQKQVLPNILARIHF